MIAAVIGGLLVAASLLVWCSPGVVTAGSRHRPWPGPVPEPAGGDGVTGRDDLPARGQGPSLPAATLVELTAVQLDAGLPLADAVSTLAATTAGRTSPELARAGAALRLGLDWDAAWPEPSTLPREVRDFHDALDFTATSGAPSTAVLRSQADLVRRAGYRRAERAAESLAVHLVLPLGLCSLPAFMCWGVLPVLMSLLPTVFGS